MGHFLDSVVHFTEHFYFAHKSLIFLAMIGLVAGLLAQMILPGRGFGFISTIIIGIIGAWLGNKYIKSHITFIAQPLPKEIVSATAGAMVLALIINIARGGKDKDKTHWRHN